MKEDEQVPAAAQVEDWPCPEAVEAANFIISKIRDGIDGKGPTETIKVGSTIHRACLAYSARQNAVLVQEVVRLKATDEFHWRILQDCSAILCLPDESPSLLPEKIRTMQQCLISEKQAKVERGEDAIEWRKLSAHEGLKLAAAKDEIATMVKDWGVACEGTKTSIAHYQTENAALKARCEELHKVIEGIHQDNPPENDRVGTHWMLYGIRINKIRQLLNPPPRHEPKAKTDVGVGG